MQPRVWGVGQRFAHLAALVLQQQRGAWVGAVLGGHLRLGRLAVPQALLYFGCCGGFAPMIFSQSHARLLGQVGSHAVHLGLLLCHLRALLGQLGRDTGVLGRLAVLLGLALDACRFDAPGLFLALNDVRMQRAHGGQRLALRIGGGRGELLPLWAETDSGQHVDALGDALGRHVSALAAGEVAENFGDAGLVGGHALGFDAIAFGLRGGLACFFGLDLCVDGFFHRLHDGHQTLDFIGHHALEVVDVGFHRLLGALHRKTAPLAQFKPGGLGRVHAFGAGHVVGHGAVFLGQRKNFDLGRFELREHGVLDRRRDSHQGIGWCGDSQHGRHFSSWGRRHIDDREVKFNGCHGDLSE